MPDSAIITTALPSAGIGVAATWAGRVLVAWYKNRNERLVHRDTVNITLDQHRDSLTFELLRAAREEVAAARVENAEMRSMQLRLVHFDEALAIIEELMSAPNEKDRAVTEKRARQFLLRMKRFSDAAGTLRNEQQIARSDPALPDDMADHLGKLS